MELSQDHLNAFYAVARAGSFTKAADQLGLTQSALSHRIKNLEGQLEATLFVRASTGIRLTDHGQDLLRYAKVQGQIEDEFIRNFKGKGTTGLSGVLRIGGASTLMWSAVVPALGGFVRAHPQVSLSYVAREVSQLPQLLHTGEVDLIVTCGKPDLHQYEEHHLGDELNVLVESTRYENVPEVFLDHDSADQTTINYLKAHDLDSLNIKRSYVDDINGVLAGLEAGLGRAVVPMHLTKKYASLTRLPGMRKIKSPVYLCYMRQPFYTKLHEAIIERLKKEIPQRLKV